ncbi:MAG: hypothetical protein V4495_25505 [Pseudomonadota bacterium]
MTDQNKASQLAQEGLALWGQDKLELAAQKTEEAIALADPNHGATPDYHGQLAGIYAQAGQNDKARLHYEQALSLQLQAGETEGGITIITSRYFLSMHLLEMNLENEALDALQPSLQAAPAHWLNCNARAHILHALGRFAEAKQAAQLAIENAPSAEKAEQLTENLKAVLSETSL